MILPSASPVSWLLALAAALAYAAPAAAASRLGAAASRNALLAAWVLHGALLVWGLWGEAPRFGFAPALSMTAWLVLTVYAVERQHDGGSPQRGQHPAGPHLRKQLALLFPGQPLHVKASAWLPLHLALGIACYGLFAAAVVHAWLMTRAERHIRQAEDPDSGIPLLTLERLTFRFVTAGFVLLSATLLAGWLFSDMLYGRAWRWDHKAVFSFLSWLVFAALLLGRARFGWRGRNAVRILYAGSALLMLAYVGSRFVLEVILGRST